MKRSLRISYSIAILSVLLTAGCSTPPENSNATANNNATANANAPSVMAQPATPPATSAPTAAPTTAAPTAVSPPPVAQPAQPAPATAQPAEKKPAPAEADKAARVTGPKLVLLSQEKELDFGKQAQDKT